MTKSDQRNIEARIENLAYLLFEVSSRIWGHNKCKKDLQDIQNELYLLRTYIQLAEKDES